MSGISGRTRTAIATMTIRSPVQVSWAESAVVLSAGALVAFFRLGDAGWRGVLWAEDGPVFLQTAYRHSLISDVLAPYAGYANAAPRTIAAAVTAFPLSWHGTLIDASAALVQACVGLLCYRVVLAHTGHRVTGLLGLGLVVAVPTGTEVLVSIANLHWFLLVGSVLAALWVPDRAGSRAATIVLVLFATTSGPFAAPVLVATGVLWWATRERHLRDLTVAATLGLALQWWVVLHAEGPPRRPPNPTWRASASSGSPASSVTVCWGLRATTGSPRHRRPRGCWPPCRSSCWRRGACAAADGPRCSSRRAWWPWGWSCTCRRSTSPASTSPTPASRAATTWCR